MSDDRSDASPLTVGLGARPARAFVSDRRFDALWRAGRDGNFGAWNGHSLLLRERWCWLTRKPCVGDLLVLSAARDVRRNRTVTVCVRAARGWVIRADIVEKTQQPLSAPGLWW